MSVNPELGTAPRPDVTGVGKYANADTLLGINRTAANPLTNLTVHWDFPEDKFPPADYDVQASFHADFQQKLPATDRLETGIAGVVAAATFTLDFSEFISEGTGTPTVELVDKDWATIFVRIRASDVGTWSETCQTTLRPPQNVPPLS